MKIISVKAVPFRIPLKIPIHWSKGFVEDAEHAAVIISTDDGIEGVGEAIPRPTIYGETLASIDYAVNKLFGPEIINSDPFDLEKIWEKLSIYRNNNCAKGAIDVALHDLIGKKLGIPLYKLLGGWRDSTPVTHRVPTDTIENMVEHCRQCYSEGIKSFKIKVGLENIRRDLDLIQAVRKALGPEAIIYIDANENYDLETAVKVINEMQNYDIKYAEEPIPIWNKKGRLELSKRISIPILADDSVMTPIDVFQEIERGALGAISVKIPRTGYYFSRKIAVLAEQTDLPIVVGTQGETALGVAASLQFALAFKQAKIPGELTSHLGVTDQVIKEELPLKNGLLHALDQPGIGVTLDYEKLNHFKIV